MNLVKLGWNERLQHAFAESAQAVWVPARIFSVVRGLYQLMTEAGELTGSISGSYRNNAKTTTELPAVGDWVAVEPRSTQGDATIHLLLPRHSKFSRKAAGVTMQEQVIAANIDTVFIVSGLDQNFNLRRIERYLTLTWNSGAQPVIILNKADIVLDAIELQKMVAQCETIAIGVPVHPVSAITGKGFMELQQYLGEGNTIALLGSSGVGKSTLLNMLLGRNEQRTTVTREGDSKGRHTTTRRQLFILPSGAMIIDTPGMRELQLWVEDESESALAASFSDIEALAVNCYFKDCTHTSEPNCAVKKAVESGELAPERLTSYKKMLRELKYFELKQQETSWQARKKDREFGKMLKTIVKNKRR